MSKKTQKDRGWSTWLELTVINVLTLGIITLILFAGGCGTGIGNPENQGTPLGDNLVADFSGTEDIIVPLDVELFDFDAPINEYAASTAPMQPNGVDCGAYSGQSTVTEVTDGQNCVRNAFADCRPARYLLDVTNSAGDRFVSFVSVEITSESPLACQLRVHTVSNDPLRFAGDSEKICTVLDPTEEIELACGIGD